MADALSAADLLRTTRAVRRRLDLTRPVPRSLLEECVADAVQAPTAALAQSWRFLFVEDRTTKAAIAELYRDAHRRLRGSSPSSADAAVLRRVRAASDHLDEHLHEVPVLLLPCVEGRPPEQGHHLQAAWWGSILPATWSFMLAARLRGLGTAWTTVHLLHEREVAELVGLPPHVAQVALIPVAFHLGTTFKPAPRAPVSSIVHWDRWQEP